MLQKKVTKEQVAKKDTLEADQKRLTNSANRSKTKLEELQKNLVSAKAGVCPACEQPTAHLDTHEKYTADLENDIVTEKEYYDDLELQLLETCGAIDELGEIPETPHTEYSRMEDALQHKHNLDTMHSQLQEKAEEENPYIEQIEGLKTTGLQEISFDTMNELTHLQEHQDFLYKLLTSKDSFIRKKIIDQNIAYMNLDT